MHYFKTTAHFLHQAHVSAELQSGRMALSEEQAREVLEMEPFPLVQAIKEASQSCEPEMQELGGNAIHQARLAVDLLESVTKNRNKSRIPSKVDQPYLKLNLITTAAGKLRKILRARNQNT